MSTDVLDATTAQLRRESQVGAYVAEGEAAEVIDAGRAQLGALLGMPPDGIAFVESATAALRALLSAWPLPQQASVAVAPSEWGPNLRTFRMHGLEIRHLQVDEHGRIDVRALGESLARRAPSLVHADLVAAHNSLVQPIDEIAAVCRQAGVALWVDAAQALGHVDTSFAADAVYSTSRKWLCGPRGVGVLGIAEPWWDRLTVEPLVLQPDRSVVGRLESDEANIAGRLGLCVAVQEHLAAGPAAVHSRLTEVGTLVRTTLRDLPGWELVPSPPRSGAIVALRPTSGQDVFSERLRLLSDHHVLVTASQSARAPLEMLPPTLRISPHVDATDAQLDALRRSLGGKRASRWT